MKVARLLTNRAFIVGVLCGVLLVFGARFVINETTLADQLIAPLLLTDTSGDADAVVVLGAGVIGECVPNLNAVRRVLLAARMFRERRAPLVVFTGGTPDGTCPVAIAMSQLAREVGIPESAIRVETSSRNTRENAERSASLLRSLGARRVLLVTDRLHMRRAAGTFTALDFAVERVSVPVYAGHENNVSMLGAGARELAALAYYRMRGWIGAGVSSPPHATHANVTGTSGGMSGGEHVSGTTMQPKVKNPSRPVVVLGASYAGGWDLRSLAGVPVINRGVSGQQSFEMLERFERDVVASRPRAVILWGFINDLFRAQDLDRSLARVRDSYTTMVARARSAGIEPILATEVTIRPPDGWGETAKSWIAAVMGKESYQDRINRHVLETNSWLLQLAAREHLLVLNLQETLGEAGGRRRREFVDKDGSHITSAGYAALTDYATPILSRHLAARHGESQP